MKNEFHKEDYYSYFDFSPKDVQTICSFEMTINPPKKPKYKELKRLLDKYPLAFWEPETGTYRVESKISHIEAPVIVSPNMWEEQAKECKISINYDLLGYRFDRRKDMVKFAEAISIQLSCWEQEIVWITDDSKRIVWNNSSIPSIR